jgi:hypothetical protein
MWIKFGFLSVLPDSVVLPPSPLYYKIPYLGMEQVKVLKTTHPCLLNIRGINSSID